MLKWELLRLIRNVQSDSVHGEQIPQKSFTLKSQKINKNIALKIENKTKKCKNNPKNYENKVKK